MDTRIGEGGVRRREAENAGAYTRQPGFWVLVLHHKGGRGVVEKQ